MDYKVKIIQKKLNNRILSTLEMTTLDLNKLKEQLAIAKLNELQDPYLH